MPKTIKKRWERLLPLNRTSEKKMTKAKNGFNLYDENAQVFQQYYFKT